MTASRRIDTPRAILLLSHKQAARRVFLPAEPSVLAPACLLCADAALLLVAQRYTRSMFEPVTTSVTAWAIFEQETSGDDFGRLHLLRSLG